ncbi:MAG TPA: type II toxin-antitoxin system HicA family toxin [Calidithermus sp.]|nr:type II toxin-antitoxin system HicA family toxin [Calidithermus sp.]
MAEGERRLRCQELLARLARFGIVQVRQRGSHILVQKPEHPGSRKGPTYPIPCPRPTAEVNPHIVRAALRHFGIDEQEFWAG